MQNSHHILVVDDHRDIREPLTKYMKQQGFRVSSAVDAAQARELLQTNRFDLIVLDIMMPGEDGLSLCRHIQATSQIPVILLTAVSDEIDRILGLELGADDYVVKPFNPRELLARVKSVLRRSETMPTSSETTTPKRFRFDGWTLIFNTREVEHTDGRVVTLTTSEFQILLAMLERPNFALSRDQLLDLTKGRAAVVFDRTIDNHVSRLRQKLEVDPGEPKLLQTVWGRGYKIACEVIVE
ncbi:MAG: response regulator [Pseudomonadota bacterium]